MTNKTLSHFLTQQGYQLLHQTPNTQEWEREGIVLTVLRKGLDGRTDWWEAGVWVHKGAK